MSFFDTGMSCRMLKSSETRLRISSASLTPPSTSPRNAVTTTLFVSGPGPCRGGLCTGDRRNGRNGHGDGGTGGREPKAMQNLHDRNLQSVDEGYTDLPRRVRKLLPRAA